MKKALLIIVVGASPLFAVVTVADIPTIQTAARLIEQKAYELQRFIDTANILALNGFTINIGDDPTNPVPLSITQKQALLVHYQQLKSDLAALQLQLP